MAYNLLPQPAGTRTRRTDSTRVFAASASLLLLFGCAAPGVPVTRQPAVLRAIDDLSAKQEGDAIVLSFTLPKNTPQGKTLAKPAAIEIYRSFKTTPEATEQPQLVTTIPPQMVNRYQKGEHVDFPDVLTFSDITAHTGSAAMYLVRTRIGNHDSADSNAVRIVVLRSSQPIEDLQAQITKTAVELLWTTPAILPKDSPTPISFRYRVYRADLSAQGSPATTANSSAVGEPAEPVLLGESTAPSYSDSSFTSGHSYGYSVRSVATYPNGSVESAQSNVLEVTPRDTFAPATPENVAATATSASNSIAAHVDLSWAINAESDSLGYNVYRSDVQTVRGMRLNATPLITPVFRDNSVEVGKQYFYRVTAVDRSGNESAPSAPIGVTVPASSEQ